MAEVQLDDALIRWMAHNTPPDQRALDEAAVADGGTTGEGTTNLQHLRLAGNYCWTENPARHDRTRTALLEFYERNRAGHRTGYEGLSPGYSTHQLVAAMAVESIAGGTPLLAARTFLRHEMTLACLCCSDARPRVVSPGGRCGKHLKQHANKGWSSHGQVNPERDYAAAAVLGISWQKQKGVGEQWQAKWADYKRLVDGRLPGLFTELERGALRLFSARGEVHSVLLDLIRDIKVPEGLHIVRGQNGHAAWLDRWLGVDGNLPAQGAVASINGRDEFLLTQPPKPPSWVEVPGETWPAPPYVELLFNSSGGRIVSGAQPSPAPPLPVPPVDEPKPQPQGGLQAAAQELGAAWSAFTGGGGRPARERMEKAVERVKELAGL